MAVATLSLSNFRSYTERTLELDPVVTLVVGPNATGKTNLLESLFVLATTRSFRARDAELIRHGEDFFRISAKLKADQKFKLPAEIALGYQITETGSEKRVQHEGVQKTLVDHLGTLRVVLFEPNDLLLIHGAPERRRRYLDFILTQTDKAYVKVIHQYRRVLAQRNRLLSDWGGNTEELFAWNIKLTELAAEIDARRRTFITHLNGIIGEVYGQVAGSREQLHLEYQSLSPAPPNPLDEAAQPDDYASLFLRSLEANQRRDIGAGFTTIGPHRDDFSIQFKGTTISTVASRGEMRTVVLALKMAELAYIEQHTGRKPLLLLDDVFSELDDSRRRFLLATLGDYQSVITTTNADVSDELKAHHTTISTTNLTDPIHG